MPVARMKDDPRYGTVEPDAIPVVSLAGGLVRVVAGSVGDVTGPAQFAATVQILDVDLQPGAQFIYSRPDGIDNVMFYAFKGDAVIGPKGTSISQQQICRFDTSGGATASSVTAGKSGLRMMVFAGKQVSVPFSSLFSINAYQPFRPFFASHPAPSFLLRRQKKSTCGTAHSCARTGAS